jgi:hypothetical protein
MSVTDVPAALMLGSRFRALSLGLSPVTIPYDSGNTRSAEVPKTYLTKDIFVRLTGSIDVTGTVTYIDEAPLGLITSIELAGDGNETLWKLHGRDAFRLAQLFHGKVSELVVGGTGVGNQPFSASFILSAEAVNMAVPVDSYLDLREFEKTELRVTWAATAGTGSIISAGTATVNAATQLECFANQSTEGLGSIGFRRFISFADITVAATQTDLTLLVPRSGLLAGILFHTWAAGNRVDNIINFITLTSDSSHDHFKRRPWSSLQFENVQRYQLDGAAAFGGRIIGYAFVDLLEDGRMASAINTEALNELKFVLDVTTQANATLRATYVFFKPLRRAVAA